MLFKTYISIFLLLMLFTFNVRTLPTHLQNIVQRNVDNVLASAVAHVVMPQNHRVRRQFDLRVSAEHDDKEDDTELALEAIANLWRSQDGNTQVEGSAKVVHRTNGLQEGNTRYSATFHLHHDYKRLKEK